MVEPSTLEALVLSAEWLTSAGADLGTGTVDREAQDAELGFGVVSKVNDSICKCVVDLLLTGSVDAVALAVVNASESSPFGDVDIDNFNPGSGAVTKVVAAVGTNGVGTCFGARLTFADSLLVFSTSSHEDCCFDLSRSLLPSKIDSEAKGKRGSAMF